MKDYQALESKRERDTEFSVSHVSKETVRKKIHSVYPNYSFTEFKLLEVIPQIR